MTTAYRLEIVPEARRGLNKLPEKIARGIIEFILGPLSENPHRLSKPLGDELIGYRSARRGDYRVIIRIDEDSRTVHITRVAHRVDVYRPA